MERTEHIIESGLEIRMKREYTPSCNCKATSSFSSLELSSWLLVLAHLFNFSMLFQEVKL
jgi:hypothetical protein